MLGRLGDGEETYFDNRNHVPVLGVRLDRRGHPDHFTRYLRGIFALLKVCKINGCVYVVVAQN